MDQPVIPGILDAFAIVPVETGIQRLDEVECVAIDVRTPDLEWWVVSY